VWETDLVIMLRCLIGDAIAPYTYEDDRLITILVIAAKYLQHEIALDESYTVNIDEETITPDPMGPPEDVVFTTLVVLKAGCLLDKAKMRDNARKSGVSVRVGPSSVNSSNSSPLYALLLKEGPCGLYAKAKFDFDFTDLKVMRALITPATGPNISTGPRLTSFGDGSYRP
jgi:hypothetical protein